MAKSTSPEYAEERSGKRRKVAAFLLAAVAIGGIGAGLTSAAWSDNTFFSTSAAAATYNLQASLDNTNWVEASSSNTAIQIPTSTFANLLPGQTRTVDVWVKNDSSVATALTATPSWSASTFQANPDVTVSGTNGTIAAGTTQKLTVQVKAPEAWDAANKGKTGTLLITVAGEATAN